ncbi:MAG TPA: TatD family hydrolase [Candidatus Acidoferrales bacterium]|jgi:TatD DNase family protein|nr:TatD family hydrolase [Candidatus Acidoferrales bacterium]
MIDTHCHIHDKQYDEDRDATMARARERGVDELVTVGCDLPDSERALAAAARYGIRASVGIHPHEAKDAPDDVAAAFAPLLADPRAVAIGETGMDFYYNHSPRDAQERVMRAQLRIARERDLPVIFHQRDAHDDFVRVLREEFGDGMRGVIHCFTGDTAQAKTFTEEFGLYLGIGGVLTFKTAEALRDAVRAVGIASIVLETDCPYLAPIPMRGKRNEPAFVSYTHAKLAEVLEADPAEVLAQTDRNARTLFRLAAR